MPYSGIDHFQGTAILYSLDGDCSVIFQINNPVLQYGADVEPYNSYQQILLNMIKILGEGYLIQKQDVFSRLQYQGPKATTFLQQHYHQHFQGREYTSITTYLILTRQVKRTAFYVYNEKFLLEFLQQVSKIQDLLLVRGLEPVLLDQRSINHYVAQILSMDFSGHRAMDNLLSGDQQLIRGERAIRSISLINTDTIDLPEEVGSYSQRQESTAMKGIPVDNLFFLHHVRGYHAIIYNQLIEIPAQQITLNKLELKRKRHSGVPDPANLICVQDIDKLLEDVARENQLLVHAHFNILLCADNDKIAKAANFIESSLFQQGIIPSRNSYNQLELFRTALPGNGVELKHYDWFLTTADAALCFFFKERLMGDEPSDFLIRFTNREGIPKGIDPSDLVMRSGRVNNRNKLVCGPSGSGKSVFCNALVEQYLLYNMDVVIVDVGHSYSGLCAYYGGRYITYREDKPITMNPFLISESEYNIEKKDFLITLVTLLWKGAEGQVSTVERDVIAQLISAYYQHYFSSIAVTDLYPGKIEKLDFNSFYEFALDKIPQIKRDEQIPFDLEEFRFVLKKFYRGGEYQTILNESADASLFAESFIVFEIDSVQNSILFPIITMIIMDLFIQKMRHRTSQRKCLILEECWKAVGSPLMAGFLLYLNKTVRKFWGEVIEVTQSLSDVLGNPILKECIISESDTVILLDQGKFKDNYTEIARLLSISEPEQKKIFTINQLDNKEGRGRFKEVYIRRGSTGEVYGVELSIYQYLVYTTEKPEKNAVEIYVKALGNYQDALTQFVTDLQDSAMPLGQFIAHINSHGSPWQHLAKT